MRYVACALRDGSLIAGPSNGMDFSSIYSFDVLAFEAVECENEFVFLDSIEYNRVRSVAAETRLMLASEDALDTVN